MAPRPHRHLSIEELERLFESLKQDVQKLTETIEEELKQRRTRRAKSLGTKVNQWLAQLLTASASIQNAVPEEQRVEAKEGGDEVCLTLEEVEKRHLIRVLRETKGNKVKAAMILGIDRRTLYRMAERFGLDLGVEPTQGESDDRD